MRRLMIAAVAAGALAIGPAAIGVANPGNGNGEPGPNGNNNFGLCTAYFAGSEQGKENKRNAPPFEALERLAEDAAEENDQSTEELVHDWCETNGQHPGQGNGPGNGGGPPNG